MTQEYFESKKSELLIQGPILMCAMLEVTIVTIITNNSTNDGQLSNIHYVGEEKKKQQKQGW